jgi:hypothetical protein
MSKRNGKTSVDHAVNSIKPCTTTLSDLCKDADMRYRSQVLLYDLSNVANDSLSQKRLSSTTHELYISEPYFTESEVIKFRTAFIDESLETEISEIQSPSSSNDNSASRMITIEAIHDQLTNFFDKRKASGDARPYEPHDMVTIYGHIFGIQKEQLKDERFLGRLRRSGLGDSRYKEGIAVKEQDVKHGKRRKKV